MDTGPRTDRRSPLVKRLCLTCIDGRKARTQVPSATNRRASQDSYLQTLTDRHRRQCCGNVFSQEIGLRGDAGHADTACCFLIGRAAAFMSLHKMWGR